MKRWSALSRLLTIIGYNRNVTGEVARVKNPDELRALLC